MAIAGQQYHPEENGYRGGSLQNILDSSVANLLSWSKSSMIKDALASGPRRPRPVSKNTLTVGKRGADSADTEHSKCPHIQPKLEGPPTPNFCSQCGCVCEVCSYIFKSKQLFSAHSHKNFCGVCTLKFRDQKTFKLHVAYHEPETVVSHRCEICKFGFLEIKNLNIHARKLHGLKLVPLRYTCNICRKDFGSQIALSIHVRTHATRRKCQCPWCTDSFITITLLYTHLRRKHTMERPYRCHRCKKDFVRKQDLSQHLKSHKSTKTFQCHICDVKLMSNRNLTLHLATHALARKKYKCTTCGVRFSQKCYMKVHQQLHEPDGKQYPCQLCSRSYIKAQNLKEHLVANHNFKYFLQCSKCKKNFISSSGLKKHIRNLNCGKRMGSARSNTRQRKISHSVSRMHKELLVGLKI